MAWTTDDLVSAVKRRAQLPANNGKLDDNDIIDLANEEMHTVVVPMLATAREDYYVYDHDESLVVNQIEYRIPAQVLAGTLYDVIIVNQNSEETGNLAQIPLQDLPNYGAASASGFTGATMFAIKGDLLVLTSNPTQSGYTLRFRYIRRPSALTAVSNCGLVTSVLQDTPTTGRLEFTCDNVPTAFSGAKLDLVQEVPNFGVWGGSVITDNIVTGASGTFDVAESDLASDYYDTVSAMLNNSGLLVQIGYWCPEQSTCVVPIPDVLHPLLVGLTAAQVLRTIGDFQGSAIEQENAQKKLARIMATFAPRTRTRGNRIIASSHPLRAGNYRRYFGGN